MKRILPVTAFLFYLTATAQDSLNPISQLVVFSAYIENYYSYDFNRPESNKKPFFLYNYNRHNEFNLNLGFVKASVRAPNFRGNIAIGSGTYMNANYAAEPGVLQNIFEANAGIKLAAKQHLWLDLGIFPSHIGFESAIGKDNWTLSRSIAAENSPYYLAGAKIAYTSENDKWLICLLALNGWQRIKRLDGNSLISFGAQLTFKPVRNTIINYSNFIGTDKPDSARLIRHYHNFYGIVELNDQLAIVGGLDVGAEQRPGNSGMNTWYSPVLAGKYKFNNKWSFSVRGEFYDDPHGVMIPINSGVGIGNEFNATGISLNIDYAPGTNFLVRVEGRSLISKNEIFPKDGKLQNNIHFVTTSFGLSF